METDVLVVGAGPTGLTLANVLGLHGIRTLLVERNAATVGEPRAVSIDDESLRTLQYLDLLDVVRPTIVHGYGSHYFSAGGRCFAKVLPDTMEFGHARRSAFRQPLLEAQLRAGLARFPSVEARFSTEMVRIEPGTETVMAEIAAPDGARTTVTARYVAACDGARSGIREALGIAMGGSTYDQQWLIVDLEGSTDRFRHTRVFCDPARPALALPGPGGTRRYEFMVLPGESAEALLDEGRARALLARHSEEDARLPIVRKVVYHFHARMADRWREGRVFLAGDAAHLTPPFAGQGMNSGLRDAHNLGWKLAYRLRGALGDAALESYEAERKPHARALIQMAINMGHVMMPRSRARALVTQALFELLSLYRPARDYVMQMKYKPKPHYVRGLVVGDAGPGLRGRMFPQPQVERPDGVRVLLDELLGHGFALLELDDGTLPTAPAAAGRTLAPALIRVIPRHHRFTAAEPGATTVRDVTGSIEALFTRAAVRGVLLRPDRYVAAAFARGAGAREADRLLDALVTQPGQGTA